MAVQTLTPSGIVWGSVALLAGATVAGWILLAGDGRGPGALGFRLSRDMGPEAGKGLVLKMLVGLAVGPGSVLLGRDVALLDPDLLFGDLFAPLVSLAVAVILFPLAVEVAWNASLSPRPFVMAIALAASLSFVTPIGYQTNLMVMGPGGYRPRDYMKAGLPLALLVMVTALTLIPWAWKFRL